MALSFFQQREKRRKEALEKAEEKRKLEEEILKKALEEKAKSTTEGKADVVVLPLAEKEDVLVQEIAVNVQDELSDSGSSGASTPLETPASTQWISVSDDAAW